ncbi:telomerase-binding protein EST1A [Lucilia sericata]|uniref:telomerase-binding protein EST1A n=1 Tax=Lucilia sericata TaxID=13632 RepID=UPI0018A87108|nr:telomerase-binding protein EST1A [Lucilia sericata]
MNRKGTREQNDISIIIGNLPKRLQEKIITREGNNNSSINGGSSINNAVSGGTTGNVNIGSVSRRQEEVAKLAICKPPESVTATSNSNGNEVTSIDYFLRMSAKSRDVEEKVEVVKPVLEASGSITQPIMSGEKQTNVAIPGLIRLNAEDAKKLNECSQDSRNGLRNHDRRNRHQTRQEILSSRYELPMSPVRQVQKLNHPMWFNALVDDANAKRLPQLFECLQNTMSHNLVIENWSNVHTIRQELQDIFKNLLLNNLKFCCEQKVDSFFWKILFYNMREHLKQQQNAANAINYIQKIITEGIEFYEDIYQQIFEKYLTKDPKQETSIKNQQRSQHKLDLMARVTAQKLLIYLGDLWRYKIKDLQGQDYEEAAKYYKQAQALVPSNGVPYNQLAIVAIHNRKKLDAIYYHMRSLMSSNAIPSAKESLLVLFDEIRKKYEETELKSSPLHYNYNNNHQSSKSMRKEVWIYPDGVRRLHRTDLNGNNNYKMIINEEKRFREMTAEELLRRITSLYLYIIGKLFTGVGMETILEHQRKLLLQLSVLLEYEPLAITRNRLMKILALNIFAIEHNLDKDTRRYHAFNFCNQIFGLILRKSHELLHTLNTNPEEFQNEHFLDLNTTLQYNRIYVLWLKQHINIWEPIKNEDHIFINSWLELEKLFNILQQENLFNVTHHNNIIFEEDIFFMGFTPLASIIPKTNRDSSSEESLQLKGRLKVLFDFQTTYVENQKRLENLATSHFINEDLNSDIKQALDDLQSEQSTKAEDDGDDENDDSDEVNEDNIREAIVANEDIEKSFKNKSLKMCVTTKQEDNQLSHLSKLKRELEAKTHVKKMYHNKLEEILKFVDTKVYIEVRPKYLLPDTNCFIDCLEDFERIVNEFKRYTLIIPLTVVKELDGLSKGVKVDSYEESLQKQRIHHYDDVSTRAKKSLDFIKTAKSHVKCATTKGSIINASLFALVEEEHVSNDDKILATAIALSKTMSSETSKDGKCFIQTELVLITTDRNLRVKALSRNLAVSELPEFLQWAKDCN